jgi:hypothetical protein
VQILTCTDTVACRHSTLEFGLRHVPVTVYRETYIPHLEGGGGGVAPTVFPLNDKIRPPVSEIPIRHPLDDANVIDLRAYRIHAVIE